MLSLLALGAIGFWVSIILLFLIVSFLVENEKGVWSFVVICASIWGMSAFYHLALWAWVKANPIFLLKMFGLYVLVGIAWSFIKWTVFLAKKRVEYKEKKDAFQKYMEFTEWTPELLAKFAERNSHLLVKASDHKGDLTFWASYWPFSILGTIFNDLFRKIWTHLYNLLHDVYQRIADSFMKEANADAAAVAAYNKEQAEARSKSRR